MRLVLAGLTVAFAIGLEMTAYPTADASIQQTAQSSAPEASEAPQEEANVLAKGDRLFVIRAPEQIDDEPVVAEQEPEKPQLTMGEFCEALTQAAVESDIPPAFFARLIWQESKFKHDAMSPVGAKGVAQFMPATAAEVGLADPLDPRQALPASAKFLRKLHDQFGNLGLAAAAYNAGPGRIQKWLARRGPLPDETRNYVRVITGNATENWTAERKLVGLEQQLPNKAPCEGIGGLSRSASAEKVPVALTPAMSEIVRTARIEAARAAAAAKKLRLALAKHGKRKTLTIAMNKTSKKSSGRIKLASAAK